MMREDERYIDEPDNTPEGCCWDYEPKWRKMKVTTEELKQMGFDDKEINELITINSIKS